MNIAIFQCIRGEPDEYQLGFCIVKNYVNTVNYPTGTMGGNWAKRMGHNSVEGVGWIAHNSNHTLVYWKWSMRIYQFDNSDPTSDKDIRLMFLIGDNEFIKGATSYALYGKKKDYKWNLNWGWLISDIIVNTFSYKDDLWLYIKHLEMTG